MRNQDIQIATVSPNGLRRYNNWCREIGLSPATAFRMRRSGKVGCIKIGRLIFITDAEIDRFLRRAERGEFIEPKH